MLRHPFASQVTSREPMEADPTPRVAIEDRPASITQLALIQAAG